MRGRHNIRGLGTAGYSLTLSTQGENNARPVVEGGWLTFFAPSAGHLDQLSASSPLTSRLSPGRIICGLPNESNAVSIGIVNRCV